MPPQYGLRRAAAPAALVLAALAAACGVSAVEPQSSSRQATWTVSRRDFVHSVRLSGTVEAVQSTTISTPRLSGQRTAPRSP